MKKITAIILSFVLCVFVVVTSSACSNNPASNGQSNAAQKSNSNNFANANKPVIGIAWNPNRNDAFYLNWEFVIQEAGGIPVNLEQIKSYDINYDVHNYVENNELDTKGEIKSEYAEKIKNHKYDNSNIDYVLAGIDGIFMPGGEDISSSLIDSSDVENNLSSGASATRDVSDYLLMTYCIDKDIPTFGVCRGMQMMSVACGASIVDDIPKYCKDNNIVYDYAHRLNAEGSVIDFVRHNVDVKDKNSKFGQIVNNDVFQNVPSLHHQGILDVDNTKLKEVGSYTSNGLKLVEAVEMPDKTFIMGTQFHPEYTVQQVKLRKQTDPCDVDTCLKFFQQLVKYSAQKSGIVLK